MKKFTRNVSLIAFATAMIAIGGASAASAQDHVVANVPFAFMVGQHRLPAGSYVVTTLADDPSIVMIESTNGHHMLYRLTVPWAPEDTSLKAKLVFVRLGHEYLLTRIAPQGEEAREIPMTPTAMERDMIKVEDGVTTH